MGASRWTCLALIALAACAPPATESRHVEWRAWLDSPGGELPFGLELRDGLDGPSAVLINGSERIPVTRVATTLYDSIGPERRADPLIEYSRLEFPE